MKKESKSFYIVTMGLAVSLIITAIFGFLYYEDQESMILMISYIVLTIVLVVMRKKGNGRK